MSNLSNLIQGLVVNAITNNGQASHQNNSNNIPSNQNAGGLGSIGNILGGLLGGQNNQTSGNLGGMLGSVLGGLNGQNTAQQIPQRPQQHQGQGMGSQAKLLVVLVPFILAWIQKQGGFHNAIKVLTQSGLGQQAQSWVANGSNEPVDPSKISTVFDDQEIEQVASQANTSKGEVYRTIANLLPQIVDAITPNGQVAGNGSTNQIQQVMSMLNQLIR